MVLKIINKAIDVLIDELDISFSPVEEIINKLQKNDLSPNIKYVSSMDDSNFAAQHFNALHVVNFYTVSLRKAFLFPNMIEKF